MNIKHFGSNHRAINNLCEQMPVATSSETHMSGAADLFCVNRKTINIAGNDIEPGWEWFVFKKRAQLARRHKFRNKRAK